ncbi:MAG: C4-type zinc ribbon domain-containing protein [Myxococcota bacterium]|nr:C4-type zinc ribbon domain-containing protein [Myxococcota bacterium]
MKSELAALEELQSLDLETLKLRNELKALPESIKQMREDVARMGELLERERQRLTEAETWKTEREKDLAQQNDLIGKSRAKLQGARNEKENKAAQREIDAIRKNIQDREEETLKILEAIEQYRVAILAHSKEFGELEEHLLESEKEVQARMTVLESSMGKTDSERKEIASRISSQVYRLYERIHKRLGVAVVSAVDGKCTGCHMEILAQRYNELIRGDVLHQCTNCFRILIYKGARSSIEPQSQVDSH